MENSTNENNSELKEEEIKEKINEIFFSKLTSDQMENIAIEHQKLSNGLGYRIGVLSATTKTLDEKDKTIIQPLFSLTPQILEKIVPSN